MCRERGKVTKYIYKRHHLSFLMYIVFLEDSRRYQCRWQLNSVIVVFAFYYAWVGALLQLRCTLHYNFLPRLFATFQHFSYFLDRIISYIHRDINKLASNLCDNVFKVPRLLKCLNTPCHWLKAVYWRMPAHHQFFASQWNQYSFFIARQCFTCRIL